jgi:hypothetical protein
MCEKFIPMGIVGRIPYNGVQSGILLCFHWPIPAFIPASCFMWLFVCGEVIVFDMCGIFATNRRLLYYLAT